MKTFRSFTIAAFITVVLCGCIEKRIVWSPDGSTAAVIGEKGLYLCDTNGRISGLLVPEVHAVAWFPDSRRMALAISGDEEKWSLQIATNINMKVVTGPVLAQETNGFYEVRVSPTSAAIVYCCENNNDRGLMIQKVVPVDGSMKATTVSQTAAGSPDWTPDGMSLVYLTTAVHSTNSDAGQLGLLIRRQVLTETNTVHVQETSDELAGLAFGPTKVRCLKDGRIVFSSIELQLPSTQADFSGRQQLFAIDARQATVTRLIPRTAEVELPPDLSSFEISPDEKHMSVLDEKGRVLVMSLVKGDVTTVQPAADFSPKVPVFPVWRTDGSLCLQTLQKTNDAATVQIALWEDGALRNISEAWPPEVRKELLEAKE